ncbi:MAG: aminoacyl-tRNA hydrolase [Alphaproteobacteria bacterium]|nr:aminoacyl-tRNA hydrolase [Alphaproteobacteria bacterium]
MLLIAGLGNPGPKYAGHRHNVGFRVIDRIAQRHAFGPWRGKFQSETAEGRLPTSSGETVKTLLIKPQTFMNHSGRAIGEAMTFYKIAPSEVVVFYDELDLAPGRLRMKTGGGAAGHNGVRSIIAEAHPDVRRARIGIGHPGDKSLVHSYVLSDFAKADASWIEPLADACAEAITFLASGEDERYQTEVMRLAPAPKGDPRNSNAAPEDTR